MSPLGYYLLGLGNVNAVSRARFIKQQGLDTAESANKPINK